MDEMIQSIYDEPDRWSLGVHTFNRGNMRIWICNGFFFCSPYQSPGLNFTFVDKIRVWKAFKWWCKNAPLHKIVGTTAT